MKTLADIIREVERARDRAERMCEEWLDKYSDALTCYETRRRTTLLDKYTRKANNFNVFTDTNISRRIEAEGVEVYEDDDESSTGRVECTARAIKRLRSIEKKLADWDAKRMMAENALDALY